MAVHSACQLVVLHSLKEGILPVWVGCWGVPALKYQKNKVFFKMCVCILMS